MTMSIDEAYEMLQEIDAEVDVVQSGLKKIRNGEDVDAWLIPMAEAANELQYRCSRLVFGTYEAGIDDKLAFSESAREVWRQAADVKHELKREIRKRFGRRPQTEYTAENVVSHFAE